jgi:manganese-dependent inorganic pyrophosphatase
MIYVIWHKVPDTDAITSAIVYAHLLSEMGHKSLPLALWEANKETLCVLEKAWVTMPDINPELIEGSTIALVDHNESAQSIANRSSYTIHSVIDHHKIWDLETWYPLILRFEPLASTNSILYKMYKEANIIIDKKIATLMLWGILSDTLHFRSPTTTEFDKSIVSELAQIAEIVDIESFAMEMFTAKSDLGDISTHTLIKDIDAKDFTFSGRKSLIACIETTNPDYCLSRKVEILETIRTIKVNEWYDFILFCVVDILNEKNTTLVASEVEANIIKQTFWADTIDWIADLWNRISRKKTIVPPLEEALI